LIFNVERNKREDRQCMQYNDNKKIRCRKEHSVSVVLSWCTLWHFLGENLSMVNQPILRNWPRKLPNLAK